MTDDANNLEAELELIRAEEARLNQRKNELMDRRHAEMRKRAEEERLAKLSQETEVRACDFNNFFVNVKVLPDIREDVLVLLRNIPGRQYDSYTQVNRIPIDYWFNFRDAVKQMGNAKVTHLLGVEGKIKKYLTQPEFYIALRERFLRVTTHAHADTSILNTIPGMNFIASSKVYEIPLTEGWRLFERLQEYTRNGEEKEILWEDNALKLVTEEIERRTKLDTIALKEDSDIVIEFLNGHELRPFQKVAVEFIDLAQGRAFAGDQMGLGKTWEAIGYAMLRNHRTVIVCPAHLKANWAREIRALTGKYPVILQGRQPTDHDVVEMLVNKAQFTIINYDILGAKTMTEEKRTVDDKGFTHVVPPMERFLWADLINMSQPDLVVADEAHYIKNTGANRSKAVRSLKSEYRLPMSGTPVLNRPGEFWAALNWVRPELFPSEERFLNQYTSGNGKFARNVGELRELLRTIMIRRLKKDVVKELPPINRITRFHELSAEAVPVYQKVLKGVYAAIDRAGNHIERNVTNILVEIGKLKEVCSNDKIDSVADLAVELWDTEQDIQDVNKGGAGKVLIFSQYKSTVRKIAQRLGQEAIFWTGDTAFDERTRLEYEFQNNPDVHFLVISLMTGQTGLNLTAAGHVIFADLYWTPAAHQQAEERAYGRLSDLHGADSYYLVAQNTIEEWVQSMLQAKLSVIDAVVEGIESERDPSIGMALIQKLQEMRGSL